MKYNYNDEVKEHEMGSSRARMKDKKDAYRIPGGNPKGKKLLEEPRHMLEDNIKIDLREI
jgi:hypothetical protein